MVKTGKVEFILSNVGSKSEKMQPFLRDAEGNLTEIFKESDNPFKNESLKEYEGKTVNITGEENEYGLLIIETIEVIEDAKKEKESSGTLDEETKDKVTFETVEEKLEKTNEANEKPEDNTLGEITANTKTPASKEVQTEPALKGFKKFLAFFRRK